MAIPDFQSCMLPVLRLIADGNSHKVRIITATLADEFSLTTEERERPMASGPQPIFYNRVAWAITDLRVAGLLERPERGAIRITNRGRSTLVENPVKINIKYLLKFAEYAKFRRREKSTEDSSGVEPVQPILPPDEVIAAASKELKDKIAGELIDQIKKCSPAFFEGLVVKLLLKMGYGGTQKDAGLAIGKSGDGGIDGFIKEDRLGLDQIYLQAKRWEANIGRPQLNAFVGALHGKGNKGVFITTSAFTKDAVDYANGLNAPTKVILIDGEQLAELMIEHNLGVSVKETYEIKKIDFDYFSGEE